ncbi:MAG: flagellar biosynthesis anti-sigma factor FlgM [Proteobacteria bacterium]|nr:flagellar biosynthesis anti-sigma factor FlgM [Pseudomonadota bacterium]MBU1387374.1 flagellar biosynthesis anti-sigma factor FlgM [Pseudomonadota bacterium]MBU1541659.1 flagellar biosynthesis anti-sigma factor FlgM [Pseudomonadota bacterium]MBU2481083.1 flagellar biosynthesis anti-sigma factor FlgM [Pseudomonadota bacterium]
MKISGTTSNYINQTYTSRANSANQDARPAKNQDEAVNSSMADSINLSNRTKDLQKISQSMDTQPTDRQKYVSDIKLKVETNQYNINVEAVAEKMTGTLMDEIV